MCFGVLIACIDWHFLDGRGKEEPAAVEELELDGGWIKVLTVDDWPSVGIVEPIVIR